MEVDEGLGIDENTDVLELVNTIALTRLCVETNVVRQTRAPAALYSEAQSALFRRNIFFRHGDADAIESTLRQLKSLLFGGRAPGFATASAEIIIYFSEREQREPP